MDKITLTKKQIELTAKKAGVFATTKEGETYLLQLTHWIDFLNERLDEAKAKMAEDAIKAGEDNILGDTLRIAVRPTGKKYEGSNPAFIKQVSYPRIDEGKVDEYMKENKSLPEGIVSVSQKITASIYVKKNKK